MSHLFSIKGSTVISRPQAVVTFDCCLQWIHHPVRLTCCKHFYCIVSSVFAILTLCYNSFVLCKYHTGIIFNFYDLIDCCTQNYWYILHGKLNFEMSLNVYCQGKTLLCSKSYSPLLQNWCLFTCNINIFVIAFLGHLSHSGDLLLWVGVPRRASFVVR